MKDACDLHFWHFAVQQISDQFSKSVSPVVPINRIFLSEKLSSSLDEATKKKQIDSTKGIFELRIKKGEKEGGTCRNFCFDHTTFSNRAPFPFPLQSGQST